VRSSAPETAINSKAFVMLLPAIDSCNKHNQSKERERERKRKERERKVKEKIARMGESWYLCAVHFVVNGCDDQLIVFQRRLRRGRFVIVTRDTILSDDHCRKGRRMRKEGERRK
jgi:hypothetical protein